MLHPFRRLRYSNWIPAKRILVLGALSIGLFRLFVWCSQTLQPTWYRNLSLAGFLLCLLLTLYFLRCRALLTSHKNSLADHFYEHILIKLQWDGRGELLHIGCRNGAFTYRCAQKYPFAHFVGVDHWGERLDTWHKQSMSSSWNTVDFVESDANELPFSSGYFDAVISNFASQDRSVVGDKSQLVTEALRVLRPGGCFAIHDFFENPLVYDDVQDLILQLRHEGVRVIHYEPHTEDLNFVPRIVRNPLVLYGMGLLYGIK